MAPSWIEVRAPTVIAPSSARITTPGQIDDSAPMTAEPMITASAAT